MPEPRLIACLIYPDVMSLDVTGPLQVFASANVERQRQGLPPFYRIQVLGERSEAVPSSRASASAPTSPGATVRRKAWTPFWCPAASVSRRRPATPTCSPG